MLPEKGKIHLAAVLLILAAHVCALPLAQAQDAPDVEIDISVLDEYQGESPVPPQIPADGSYPRILSLQPLRSAIPSLTGPGKQLEKPFPVSKEAQKEMVSFPVQVKDKGNKYAGSFGRIPPVPGRKPAIARAFAADILTQERHAVPVPPRRPAIQKASPQFVETARKAYALEAKADRAKGKPVVEGPDVPAMPPLAVQEEILLPPPVFKVDAKNDPLGGSLVVPDRKAMVKSIESAGIIKRAEKKPSLPEPEKKSVHEIEPASGGPEAKAVDITEKPDDHIPRRPSPGEGDEKEYVSVPFNPALAEADEQIRDALDQDVLPILRENPRWRLQIQAFAAKPAENGEEIDARRASLSRALSVREHLLKNGIEAQRMDVRALGVQTDRTPADRVDFIFFDPAPE